MGKILVVEPNRMLQQAITLALFPDHEVKVASAFPEASELENFAAVIVDGASLGEPGEASRRVQASKIPTVWVESVPAGQAPRREKLISIQAPMDIDALQSALAECLGGASKSKRSETAAQSVKAKEGGAESPFAAAELIELVDVVEGGPGPKARQARQKKTK